MLSKTAFLLVVAIATATAQTCSSGQECPRKCVDAYPECAGWAQMGYCARDVTNLQRAVDMEKSCPVSCGYCKETCDDLDCTEDCEARAAVSGACDNSVMQTRCKKTCKACVCSNKNLGCPTMIGLCNSNVLADQIYIRYNCPATCGLCQPEHSCSVRDASGKCPRDWKYNPATDKCYYSSPTLKNYADNSALCLAAGGNVTSVTNAAENSWLSEYLPPSSRDFGFGWGNMACFHIGLRRVSNWFTDAYWTDGTPYTYNNWDQLSLPAPPNYGIQPNNGVNENDVRLCHPGYPNAFASGGAIITDKSWHDQITGGTASVFCKRSVCPEEN